MSKTTAVGDPSPRACSDALRSSATVCASAARTPRSLFAFRNIATDMPSSMEKMTMTTTSSINVTPRRGRCLIGLLSCIMGRIGRNGDPRVAPVGSRSYRMSSAVPGFPSGPVEKTWNLSAFTYAFVVGSIIGFARSSAAPAMNR